MPIPAKFAGQCKDCGKEFKAGENIDRNKNDKWCALGKNCPLKDPTQKTSEDLAKERDKANQQRIDQMVNDKTPEMTASAIEKILKICWQKSFQNACDALKGASDSSTNPSGWKETMILAQVFFKEYSAHYRSLVKANA